MKKILTFAAILLLLTGTGCSALVESWALPTQVPTIALPTDEALSAPSTTGRTPEPSPTLIATPTLPPAAAAPVWAASPVDQAILKIDPATNAIEAVIIVEGNPDRIAASKWFVWALDRTNNRLFRINPDTNTVTARIDLPPGRAEALAAAADVVYVGMTGQINLAQQSPGPVDEVIAPSWVLKIGAASAEIEDQFAVQPVKHLALQGTKLWVLSRAVIDTPVQLLDPSSRQGWTVPLRNAPEWLPADAMAVDTDNLWLLSTAYGKIFHATTGGEILAAVNLEGRMPTGYADLLLTSSGLWAATPWGTVLHIDPITNRVKGRVELDIPLTQLIDGGDSIWVASLQTGQIFRIDPERNEVIAQIATGTQLQPTIVPSPTPRVMVWRPCPDAPTSRLKVGEIAYVAKEPPISNRVREEPNRDAEILGLIHPGGAMTIIDGPTCAEGWVWWKIKTADLEGWTAEGSQVNYWLIPLYK